MLKRSMINAAGTIACVICLSSAAATAAPEMKSFSADAISQARGERFEGKIYATKDKVRMEMAGAVTITRSDKNVMWMLMPADKIYMEQPFDPMNAMATGADESKAVEKKPLGQEAVSGRQADKFLVTYEYNGARTSVYEWDDPALKMPVKVADVNGDWSFEYRNISTAPISDSVFEIPSGYRKLLMPSMPSGFEMNMGSPDD